MNHYIQTINEKLHLKINSTYKVLDLFAGCGGLSLGFEAAGFETIGYEMEQAAVDTYNKKLHGHCIAQKLTVDTYYQQAVDIIIGGPPCQAFSVGGQQKGISDERNGFPVFIKSIQELKPKLGLFENVRGMLYSNKSYFEKIINDLCNTGYTISYQLLNAVNYGIPQNRERLFVIGHRNDFNFPKLGLHKVTVQQAIGDLINNIHDKNKILTPSIHFYGDKFLGPYLK